MCQNSILAGLLLGKSLLPACMDASRLQVCHCEPLQCKTGKVKALVGSPGQPATPIPDSRSDLQARLNHAARQD